jgi:hypothetical protein
MSKVIVGISLSTAAFVSVLVGLSVCALCVAMSCKTEPQTRDSVVLTPLPQLLPSGSIGTSKEADLERQFGKVDKSKLNEVKQGLFDRIAQRRQSRAMQDCSNCTQTYRVVQRTQSIYYQPASPQVAWPSYSYPSFVDVPAAPSAPAIQPLVVQEEPAPEIDEQSCKDGSCALKPTAIPSVKVWW